MPDTPYLTPVHGTETPEEAAYQPASRARRASAAVLDGLAFIACLPVGYFAGSVLKDLQLLSRKGEADLLVAMVMWSCPLLLLLVGIVLGRGPGMLVLNLRFRREDGTASPIIAYLRAFARVLLYLVAIMLATWPLLAKLMDSRTWQFIFDFLFLAILASPLLYACFTIQLLTPTRRSLMDRLTGTCIMRPK